MTDSTDTPARLVVVPEGLVQEIATDIADYAVGERNNAGMYLLVSEFATDLITRKLAAPSPSEQRADSALSKRLAPVQGYAAGIPWSMHLRAYDAYCKLYGPQKALIEGGCRGGFGVGELSCFIPGWRDELSHLNKLQAALDAKDALLDEAGRALKQIEEQRPKLPIGAQYVCNIAGDARTKLRTSRNGGE